MNLAIVVVPTRADAEIVLKELNAGVDFGVPAKEKSSDATAVDGGYIGALEPARPCVFGALASGAAPLSKPSVPFPAVNVMTSAPVFHRVLPITAVLTSVHLTVPNLARRTRARSS